MTLSHWKDMMTVAINTAKNAYAPYSNFSVGTAVRTLDGDLIGGCNVENAAYPLGTCAERGAISAAIASGHRDFSAILVYTETSELTPPCGACRQVITELFSPAAKVRAVNHLGDYLEWSVSELLPNAFTPHHLTER